MDNISSIQISTWYQSDIDHWRNCKTLKRLSFELVEFEFAAVFSWCEMSFNGLRLDYALEGSSNYIAWKDRMEAVLDDNGLKEFIDAKIPKPTSSDTAILDAWQKKTTKCRRILLECVKDHIVSSLHGKASPFLMWKDLTDLFQSKSD